MSQIPVALWAVMDDQKKSGGHLVNPFTDQTGIAMRAMLPLARTRRRDGHRVIEISNVTDCGLSGAE
jgi:hypothetical protein